MEETKLDQLDIVKVDLVNVPANKRRFAVIKDAGAQKDMEGDMAEETTNAAPAEVEKEVTVEKALEVLKSAKLTAGVLKALEDLLEANKPKEEQPKPVEKSATEVEAEKQTAILKDQIVALQKQLRMKDLEPLCKGLGLDADKVFGLELVDKGMADYFVGKLTEARTQNEQLMKERGTSAEPEGKGEDAFMAEVEKVAKAEKLDTVAAAEKVAKERPELWDEHVQARRQAGR